MNLRADGSAFLDLAEELDAVLAVRVDLAPIRQRVIEAVKGANRDARLAGLDNAGRPLAPLAESTLARRQGSPVPFVEHGEDSRVIRGFVVDVRVEPGGMTVGAVTPGVEWLGRHATGEGRLPVRDLAGLPMNALEEVDRLVIQEADRQVAEAAN